MDPPALCQLVSAVLHAHILLPKEAVIQNTTLIAVIKNIINTFIGLNEKKSLCKLWALAFGYHRLDVINKCMLN